MIGSCTRIFTAIIFCVPKPRTGKTTYMFIDMELVNSIRVCYVVIKNEDLLYTDRKFFPKYAVKY